MKEVIYVKFNNEKYKLVFTTHGGKRIMERNISLDMIIDSIENYDRSYIKYGKQVVEKQIYFDTIRTVFNIKPSHIILITSMILGK